MTAYFIRRFLLIIPTFIGITLAVFLVMQFVPGGPVERQIMRYQMAAMTEGGAAGGAMIGRGSNALPEEQIRAHVTQLELDLGAAEEVASHVLATLQG